MSKGSEFIVIVLVYLVSVCCWLLHPENFIADDSFFYLVTARNLALTGHQTFSRVISTNGMHPLWLYTLAGYTYVVSLCLPALLRNPAYAIPLSAAFVGAGAYNFWKVARALGLSALFVLLPLGFVGAFPVLYSEAHVLYFALSLVTLLVVRHEMKGEDISPSIGATAALVMLARLDSVFFVSALFAWYLAKDRRLKPVLGSGVVCSALVLPYLICNIIEFGGMVPVSGWIKSAFPHCFLKGYAYRSALDISLFGFQVVWGILPIGAAILMLPRLVGLRSSRGVAFVYLAASVAELVYVALYTRYASNWYWYYVEPVILGSFVASVGLPSLSISVYRLETFFVAVVSIALLVTRFVRVKPWPAAEWLSYLQERGIRGQEILVSDCPGYPAFFSNDRILAADMLTASRPFVEKLISSTDAFRFMSDYFGGRGSPIGWIIYIPGKNEWLRPSQDLTHLSYCSPKTFPVCRVIGTMEVGPPEYIADGRRFVVWRWRNPSGVSKSRGTRLSQVVSAKQAK